MARAAQRSMRIVFSTLAALVLVVGSLALAGCAAPGAPAQQAAHKHDDGKLHVITSFYPMYDFTKKVGGDHIDVTCLVPTGTEPHEWEPSPQDMTTIAQADLLIINGAGMEHWVDSVAATLGDDMPPVIDTSAGLTLRDAAADHQRDGVAVDAAAPGEDPAATHDEHEHGDDHEHGDGHDHGTTDPHVWLAPLNAREQMRAIAEALEKADPDHAADYKANFDHWNAEFEKLDNEFRTQLSGLPRHSFVAAHEAYGYICDAYGLDQIGIEGLTADSEPDAQRMSQIIDHMKKEGITTVFFEDLISPRTAEVIAQETGAKARVLNPLEGLTDEQIAAGADYFSVQRDNLKALVEALS